MLSTRLVGVLTLVVLGTAAPGFPQIYRRGQAAPGAVGEEPLATFTGAVQDIDKKILRIKGEEANTLQFVCDRKTQYFDGGKRIKIADIKPGDRVTVETKRFRNGELEAINVRLEHPKTENAGGQKTS